VTPIKVVSLFSGCGAADYALHRASEQTGIPVEVVMAVDSWPVAARVRDANLPGVRTTVANVKELTRADLPEHDLVIGGPPCQSHSTAGPKDCRCHIGGPASPRCCLADFKRLADGSAWLMENVRSRLINAPWSEQFCALDFGDVTTRRRWFYSDHLLHVHKTPGPRRFGHIRDHEADRLAIRREAQRREEARARSNAAWEALDDDEREEVLEAQSIYLAAMARVGDEDVRDVSSEVAAKRALEEQRQGRTYGFPPRGDDDALGSLGGSSSWRVQSGSTLVTVGMRSYPQAFTEIPEDGVLGSITSHTHDQPLRVGMRGHGSEVTIIGDGDPLSSSSSSSSSSSHGTPGVDGVRCPSLLEMARAHSIPDSFDWAGATKTQRGLLIANSWPIGMGTGVLAAMLRAVAATLERAA
jgi:site-specific DNA-cytosine methylase